MLGGLSGLFGLVAGVALLVIWARTDSGSWQHAAIATGLGCIAVATLLGVTIAMVATL